MPLAVSQGPKEKRFKKIKSLESLGAPRGLIRPLVLRSAVTKMHVYCWKFKIQNYTCYDPANKRLTTHLRIDPVELSFFGSSLSPHLGIFDAFLERLAL